MIIRCKGWTSNPPHKKPLWKWHDKDAWRQEEPPGLHDYPPPPVSDGMCPECNKLVKSENVRLKG